MRPKILCMEKSFVYVKFLVKDLTLFSSSAMGLLIIVCGMVWVPVIKEKYNKQRHNENMNMYHM